MEEACQTGKSGEGWGWMVKDIGRKKKRVRGKVGRGKTIAEKEAQKEADEQAEKQEEK